MKKFLIIFMSVMLLVVLALPTMAAEMTLTASASKTTAYLNEDVVITISTSGMTPYTSMGFFIQYDPTVFEFKSRSWGMAVIDATTKDFDSSTGKVTAVWKDAGAYSGEIIKITLTVKKAVPGNTTISFSDAACKNESSNLEVGTSAVQVALDCVHSYDPWIDLGNKHQRECSKCHVKTPEEDHDWDDGIILSPPSCNGSGTIQYKCLICETPKEETVDPTGHKWKNDCDTTCDNGCGETREVTHKYSTTYSNNKTYHWYACTVCGNKKDEAKHTPGPAATESSAQLCTVCNYEIAPILPHEHEISDEWFTDGQYHWHICTKTGCKYKLDDSRHVYDDNCDVTCNTCNYTRSDAPHTFREELQASAEGHWQVCAKCGTKSEVWEHTPGPEATETTKQVCTECNFILAMELSHVHIYGDTWYSDEECHWQSCEDCTLSTPTEDHLWDDGVEQDDGSILYTCSVCAYELTLSEPMATEPETTPPTQTPGTTKPVKTEDSEKFPWQWAGLAAIVLMLVGVVLLVIEFVRSRKTNMHGKFSK